MSSEFAELRSIWYTEEELQEQTREFAHFLVKNFGHKKWFREKYRGAFEEGFKEGVEESRREIAAKLIQRGMSLEQVSQITELPVETLESLQTKIIEFTAL